jgi:metallo-beta-lactamase family protein
MATGGRVLHHLMRWLPDESTVVFLVGFQARGTRGRTIESGAPSVKIFGQQVPIRARVEKLSSLSAHADRSELLRWLRSCSGSPKQALVVHGEPPASQSFSDSLRKEFSWNSAVAEYARTVDIC